MAKRSSREPVIEKEYDPDAVELIDRLFGDILSGSCVVFLGAGSTTERLQLQPSFYDRMKAQARFPESELNPSFPRVMQFFCNELDGGHHHRLITEAIKYIEAFCLPGEERNVSTLLTSVLAQVPFLNRFVTTNWDPFLERSLDVLVPMIEDRDLGFWDDRRRQVLKIHGCITRPYSLIATETDYQEVAHRNPLIFNKLRDLMATKTFVFTGCSMRDSDFQEVWSSITGALGRFGRLAYAINPGATDENIEFWRTRGVKVINTWDLQVFEYLLQKLEADRAIPSRSVLRKLRKERDRILKVHLSLRQESEGTMATSMYQDGILHAAEEVLTSSALGTKTSQDVDVDLRQATDALQSSRAKDNRIEVAYWSGRREVLARYCGADIGTIPTYFHPTQLIPISDLFHGKVWDEESGGQVAHPQA